jgi:hypothetical protein
LSVSKSSFDELEKPRSRSMRSSGRVSSPHDARTRVEECIVDLHSLATYNKDELTPNELKFLGTAKRNLAAIHRRLTKGEN